MKIFIRTFGCRVNQVESQSMAEAFSAAGHELCPDPAQADICVFNTCTVTERADKDVERELRGIARKNPGCRVVVTGCYASLFPDKVRGNAPQAIIVPNGAKNTVISVCFPEAAAQDISWRASGHREHSRAFIKIQDGCRGGCNYCIVPQARSVQSSKPLAVALDEIRALDAGGFNEVVLCGINIGDYKCPETGAGLPELLENIFARGLRCRIRFSSIEPANITPALLKAAASGGQRFCDYFHIPLQSGCDKVLREMGRRYTTAFYAEKISLVRAAFPNAGLYCDVIAGYPTETQEDFSATEEFIRAQRMSGLHPFRFSPRPRTKAAGLPQLPRATVNERGAALRALDVSLRAKFAQSLVGSVQRVLIEKTGPESRGVAANFQRVSVGRRLNPGSMAAVAIESAEDGLCLGSVL